MMGWKPSLPSRRYTPKLENGTMNPIGRSSRLLGFPTEGEGALVVSR
jgi:hypothetical protein